MSSTLIRPADLVEEIAAGVHEAWMTTQLAAGITSRPAADGSEQMVPYDELADHIQELDRSTVRAVLAALEADGIMLVRRPAEQSERERDLELALDAAQYALSREADTPRARVCWHALRNLRETLRSKCDENAVLTDHLMPVPQPADV